MRKENKLKIDSNGVYTQVRVCICVCACVSEYGEGCYKYSNTNWELHQLPCKKLSNSLYSTRKTSSSNNNLSARGMFKIEDNNRLTLKSLMQRLQTEMPMGSGEQLKPVMGQGRSSWDRGKGAATIQFQLTVAFLNVGDFVDFLKTRWKSGFSSKISRFLTN